MTPTSPEIKMFTFTEDQFNALFEDRQESKLREERALSLVEQLQQEKLTLMAGLLHFSRDEVATMFQCSTRQLQEYEREGKLIPTRMLGKVLYSVETLQAYVKSCKEPSLGEAIRKKALSNFPSRHQRVMGTT